MMAHDRAIRRLTTILAAAVVGDSKLMSVDEEATPKTLGAWRAVPWTEVHHRPRIQTHTGTAQSPE